MMEGTGDPSRILITGAAESLQSSVYRRTMNEEGSNTLDDDDGDWDERW